MRAHRWIWEGILIPLSRNHPTTDSERMLWSGNGPRVDPSPPYGASLYITELVIIAIIIYWAYYTASYMSLLLLRWNVLYQSKLKEKDVTISHYRPSRNGSLSSRSLKESLKSHPQLRAESNDCIHASSEITLSYIVWEWSSPQLRGVFSHRLM